MATAPAGAKHRVAVLWQLTIDAHVGTDEELAEKLEPLTHL